MPILRRLYKAERQNENQLITGLIISDRVLHELYPSIKPEIFELEVSKKIISWIIQYWDKYNKAPKIHIKDIFEAERENLKQGLDVEVAEFLNRLSEDYEKEGINEDFIIDNGKKYLEERHLRKMANDVNALLDLGKTEEAKKIYEGRKKIIQETNYRWVKPFDDPHFMNQVFEEADSPLYKPRGAIGTLMGELRAGWLLTIMGPMKRGKSWIIQDLCFDALMSGKKTALISIEMKDKHLAPRLYKQLGGFGDEGGLFVYPCFDCFHNQDNTCNKKIRKNKMEAPETFDPLNPTSYDVCTACRGNYPEDKDYLPTVWYFTTERPKLDISEVRKVAKKFGKHFGKNLLRVISFPAFSATMDDIENALDELVDVEGFIPQVIATDYAGIMASKMLYKDPRFTIGEIVKDHKRMAQERNALVITGAQSLGLGRAALNKDMQDESDIAENAQILAHTDILASIDQTVDEKEKDIWRIGVLEHRWKKFNKRKQAMILNQLELGQPVIDSEIIYWSGVERKR